MSKYEFDCKVCGKHRVKNVGPARFASGNLPQYCCNVCKFEDMHLHRKPSKFTCEFCGEQFERLLSPGDKIGFRKFCRRSCQIKAMKLIIGQQLRSMKTLICQQCGGEFQRLESKRDHKFCTKECRLNSNTNRTHQSYEACLKRWTEKHGEDTAQRMLEKHIKKRSDASIRSNTGRILSEKTKHAISKSVSECYVTGKLKPFGGMRTKPVYKNVTLRSQLELRAVKFLEKRDNLILNETLIYEDPTTRVRWADSNGKLHVYHPDFYDVINDIVYEVKPKKYVDDESDELLRKRQSVLDAGFNHRYLTDIEIDRHTLNV